MPWQHTVRSRKHYMCVYNRRTSTFVISDRTGKGHAQILTASPTCLQQGHYVTGEVSEGEFELLDCANCLDLQRECNLSTEKAWYGLDT